MGYKKCDKCLRSIRTHLFNKHLCENVNKKEKKDDINVNSKSDLQKQKGKTLKCAKCKSYYKSSPFISHKCNIVENKRDDNVNVNVGKSGFSGVKGKILKCPKCKSYYKSSITHKCNIAENKKTIEKSDRNKELKSTDIQICQMCKLVYNIDLNHVCDQELTNEANPLSQDEDIYGEYLYLFHIMIIHVIIYSQIYILLLHQIHKNNYYVHTYINGRRKNS